MTRIKNGHTAHQRDELASPHSITSSARASSVGGSMGTHLREIAERFQVCRTKSVKQSPQLIAWITEYGEACSLHHFRESFREFFSNCRKCASAAAESAYRS